MVKTYRRRRYQVEAVQWTGDNDEEVRDFVEKNSDTVMGVDRYYWPDQSSLVIKTLEKSYYVGIGDMVVRYPDGDLAVSTKAVFDGIFEELKPA